jgi:sugar-specific transcriptional regulator TrmB
MTTFEQIFNEMGLTNLEVKIYRALLNDGASSASEISQKTGIHRRNVYDCVERMLQKGFISCIKENNRMKYTLANPQFILQKLQDKQKSFEDMLPELMGKFNAMNEKKETLVYKGKPGLRLVFEDQLRVGREVLVNATTVDVDETLKYFFPKYHLLRKKKGIKTRMIFNVDYKNKKKELSKIPLCDVRFIENFNTSPMSQYIYGDNVAFVVWSENPIAILIREKAVAQGFKDNFELLWKIH